MYEQALLVLKNYANERDTVKRAQLWEVNLDQTQIITLLL